MPRPASGPENNKKGLGNMFRALIGGAAALGAASAAEAAEMPTHTEAQKPTEYSMRTIAPAPEMRTPAGQKIEMRVPDSVHAQGLANVETTERELAPEPQARTLAPEPQARPLTQEEVHARTIEPAGKERPLSDFKL